MNKRRNVQRGMAAPVGKRKGIIWGAPKEVWMGMHYINDHNLLRRQQKQAMIDLDKYNVQIGGDLIAWATKEIKQGEELFLNYAGNTGEESAKESKEEGEEEEGKEEEGEEEEGKEEGEEESEEEEEEE